MAKNLTKPGGNEEDHFNNHQPKIQCLSCPRQMNECIAPLGTINRCFSDSQMMRLNKDYTHSIHSLEKAFDCTYEIREASCESCACLFREHLIASMENLHTELQELTSGWFSARDYRSSLELATRTLQACRDRR